MKRNLLLISNSTLHGSGYLDHCINELTTFLKGKKTVLFIPYARPSGISYDAYTKIVRERLKVIQKDTKGIHEYKDPVEAIQSAEAVFIGGGNTFVLLKTLYDNNIIAALRQRILEGMPYIGTSAGSNVATKSIQTTNDMPIVYPPSFQALHVVPFYLNPHYLEPAPNSTHMVETRETRIKEFHCYNQGYVVGLREGALLHIKDETVILKGSTGAKIFKENQKPKEYLPGDYLDFLMK